MSWLSVGVTIIGLQTTGDDWVYLNTAHISDIQTKGNRTTVRMSSGHEYKFDSLDIRKILKDVGWFKD